MLCISVVGLAADATKEGHVMLSYQWDSKETVLKIRDRLKTAGYKVWIDEDDMGMYIGSSVFAYQTKINN